MISHIKNLKMGYNKIYDVYLILNTYSICSVKHGIGWARK